MKSYAMKKRSSRSRRRATMKGRRRSRTRTRNSLAVKPALVHGLPKTRVNTVNGLSAINFFKGGKFESVHLSGIAQGVQVHQRERQKVFLKNVRIQWLLIADHTHMTMFRYAVVQLRHSDQVPGDSTLADDLFLTPGTTRTASHFLAGGGTPRMLYQINPSKYIVLKDSTVVLGTTRQSTPNLERVINVNVPINKVVQYDSTTAGSANTGVFIIYWNEELHNAGNAQDATGIRHRLMAITEFTDIL